MTKEESQVHYYHETIDTRMALLELSISHLKKELKRIEDILNNMKSKRWV